MRLSHTSRTCHCYNRTKGVLLGNGQFKMFSGYCICIHVTVETELKDSRLNRYSAYEAHLTPRITLTEKLDNCIVLEYTRTPFIKPPVETTKLNFSSSNYYKLDLIQVISNVTLNTPKLMKFLLKDN